MNHAAAVVAGILPAVTMIGGGTALLPTRSRLAGLLMILSGFGVLVALGAWATGHGGTGWATFTAAIALPLCLAVLSYPTLRHGQSADYCALVLVVGAGVIATVMYARGAVVGAMALALVLGLVAHLWWRFENSDEEDRLAVLWLSLSAATAAIVLGHATFLTTETAAGVIGALAFATVGPAMAIGVRRPRIVDVRGLIVQVVVLVVVLVVYIALFVGAVSVLDMAGQPDPTIGVLALLGALAATSSIHCASCCEVPSTRSSSATGRIPSTPRRAWSAASATTRCWHCERSVRRWSCPTPACRQEASSSPRPAPPSPTYAGWASSSARTRSARSWSGCDPAT